MRISDWSSDVFSSDLRSSMLACCHQAFINATPSRGGDVSSTCACCAPADAVADGAAGIVARAAEAGAIGRAACRDRVGQYVKNWGVAVAYNKTTKNDMQHITKQQWNT